MAVVAIGGDLLMPLFGGPHQAHPHGFLTDIEMAKAADQAHAVKLPGPFLETADKQHVVIEFFEGFRVAFGGFWHGLGVPFFWFFVELDRVVASPKPLGKTIVILLRRTFRTLFADF